MQSIALSASSINQISNIIVNDPEFQKSLVPNDKRLSRKEAARALNICADSLTKYAIDGLIPYETIGKDYLFKQSDVDCFAVRQQKGEKR